MYDSKEKPNNAGKQWDMIDCSTRRGNDSRDSKSEQKQSSTTKKILTTYSISPTILTSLLLAGPSQPLAAPDHTSGYFPASTFFPICILFSTGKGEEFGR